MNDTLDIEIVEAEPHVIRIREGLLYIVNDRVEKANRRLAKAGLAERFELLVTDRQLHTEHDPNTDLVIRRYNTVQVELVTPQIGYNGWTFVATLNFEQGGTVVRTVPGQSCSYRPTDKACDHCGTVRARTETFVVRNESGEFKQLGRNCLELFFGLKPNLWVYDVDLSGIEDDDERGSYGSRGVEVELVENIVAAALAATEGGIGYVSKAAAEAQERESTSGRTSDVLYARHQRETGRDAQYAREYNLKLDADREAAKGYLADGTVAKVIEVAKAIEGDSEYAENIRVLANSEQVGVKSIGFVASFVAVYARVNRQAAEVKAQAEAKASRRNEWFGAVGDKKVETIGTVTRVLAIEGQYGTSYLVEWLTEDGLTAKWFASNPADEVEEGAKLRFTGTIKGHDEYKGFKATLFTRVKTSVVA